MSWNSLRSHHDLHRWVYDHTWVWPQVGMTMLWRMARGCGVGPLLLRWAFVIALGVCRSGCAKRYLTIRNENKKKSYASMYQKEF